MLVTTLPWLTSRVPPPGATSDSGLLPFARDPGRCRGASAWPLRVACSLRRSSPSAAEPPSTAVRRRPEASSLRLTVFDVGQGESMLLESPAGSSCWSTPAERHSAVAASTSAAVCSRLRSGPAASGRSTHWWSPTAIRITSVARSRCSRTSSLDGSGRASVCRITPPTQLLRRRRAAPGRRLVEAAARRPTHATWMVCESACCIRPSPTGSAASAQ